ncbi:MAG: 50S ribosomal protein L6 [Candidatus Omnitrophota bacterium]|jgi:large subunit ribosomal protein L6
MSRIGRRPIAYPKEVKIEVKNDQIFIEGPKGKLNWNLPDRISVEMKENRVFVKSVSNTKIDKSLHGLSRALIANMVKGVVDGYVKELEIQGVGFRAQLQGNSLNMQLGFSHLVNVPIPEGIKVEVPKPTSVIISGIDKQKVGQIAAEIHSIYPPEPYKGKGIRFVGELVKRKVGKAQATGKGK